MYKLQKVQPGGFWLVLSAAILWGTIGVATQAIYNLDTTTSLFINLGRLLIASPVLFAASWRVVGPRMFNIRRRDRLIMLLTGLFLAVSQATYFAAIRYAGVTIATLLTICIAPVTVVGLSVLLNMEKLTGRLIVALLCAVIGSILLVGLQSPQDKSEHFSLGILFSIIAAMTYACMIVCGRFLAADYHPLQVTALTFSIGALFLLLINFASGIVAVHTTQGWLLILYLGLIPTALAYWLFQSGLRTVSATTASIVSMLDPLVAAGLAWVLFGERLAALGLAGAILLILSVTLLSPAKKE